MKDARQEFTHDTLQFFYLSFRFGQGFPRLSHYLLALGAHHNFPLLERAIPPDQRDSALQALGVIAANMQPPSSHRPVRSYASNFREEWNSFSRYIQNAPYSDTDVGQLRKEVSEHMINTDLTHIVGRVHGRYMDTDPRASYYRRYVLAQEPTTCKTLDRIFADVRNVSPPQHTLAKLAVQWDKYHPDQSFFPVPSAIGGSLYERPW